MTNTTTNTATPNRRSHKRILVSSPTTIQAESGHHPGKILNISAGGAGIELDVELADQTRITVNIDDMGFIPARVVRQMKDGVGVRFEISADKEERFIQQITRIVEKKRQEQAAPASA
ncbi:PilZ domain-containing protein [Sneathiella chinensis]|uniref:PilZ domain-containing protein n=1 Tax=Sneathiella chinensis TaxID=349750 RepID=A0ABQ5U876_9PROT|nr:PilZ domain-containing protein [Sneathiella chinensis]GLQ07611.1 hypothetical protein GCM10007924_28320 [Sneathiella chinensis]